MFFKITEEEVDRCDFSNTFFNLFLSFLILFNFSWNDCFHVTTNEKRHFDCFLLDVSVECTYATLTTSFFSLVCLLIFVRINHQCVCWDNFYLCIDRDVTDRFLCDLVRICCLLVKCKCQVFDFRCFLCGSDTFSLSCFSILVDFYIFLNLNCSH